jgi:heme exporter protein B
MVVKEIQFLIKKEILLEWKQKHAFTGILLYIVSTIFVCFLSFKRIIDPDTWNTLFWIILLFGSVNAVAKSFIHESRDRQLYYYTIASPEGIILSKIIYNVLLLGILSLASFFIYALLLGNVVADLPLFLVVILLGSTGLGTVFTMVSAIASKANNSAVLMAILGFPLILPMLLIIIRLSKNAIHGFSWDQSYQYGGVLLLLNLIVVVLSYILFPYLWRD